jgi:RND family efflux transporter MFP subunit
MAAPASSELRQDLAALKLDRPPATRRPRRWRWVALGVCALGLAGLARRWRAGDAIAVEVARPAVVAARTDGARVPVLAGSGYVVSGDRYIAIGVRVPGRIERYFAEEGDRVQRGDPLVQIDAREYEATLRRAQANVQQARALATLRAKELARFDALARRGVIARNDLDVKRAEAATATAGVAQAEADVHAAEVALEYTTLRAPTSGVILAKLKEVGEIAVPGGFSGSGDLVRLANLEDLRGQVDITEAEIAKIRMGQHADVVPDAYPDRRYAAKVVKLYPQVDRQKGTLRVEVQILEPDDRLSPDMSARVTFLDDVPAAPGGDAVLAPQSAVHRDGERTFVWVVADGVVHRTPVALGKTFGEQVQVTDGLRGEEAVVVSSTGDLADGRQVTTAR